MVDVAVAVAAGRGGRVDGGVVDLAIGAADGVKRDAGWLA